MIQGIEEYSMETEDIFSSKCDERCHHAQSVLSKMNILREDKGQLCDIILRVAGDDFPAHKVVLATSCDYFAAMFSCGLSESQLIFNSSVKAVMLSTEATLSPSLPVVELGSPLTSAIMRHLLGYMYLGMSGVHVDNDNVQELLPAAAALQLDNLKQACAVFLLQQVEASNVLGIRRFAELHHCPQLYNCAQEFVVQHFDAVCAQEEWLGLALTEVVALIEREDLQTQSEERVYEAVMRWVCHELKERSPHLPQLLRHVRMCVLSAQYLTDVVDTDPKIRRLHACRDLVDDAKRYHLRPDLRHVLASQEVRFRPRAGQVEHLVVIAGFGADQAPTDSVEMFSPETGKWSDLPSLPQRYRYVSACALGSCIYTIGGFDGRERLNTVAMLDVSVALHNNLTTSTNYITSLQQMESVSSELAVSNMTAMNVMNGSGGGGGTWRWLSPMHHRRGLAATCTYHDLIYVAGGFDGVARLRSLEVYHPKIDEWRLLEDMNVCREGAGLVVVQDTLYALGGYNGDCLLNSMECYSLATGGHVLATAATLPPPSGDSYTASTGAWRVCPSMQMRRSGAGCAVVADNILVCGGFGGADGQSPIHLDCVESYDTRTGQWTMVKSMNVPRCYVGAACLGNKVYVAAGYDGTSLLDTLESYDPVENRWHFYPEFRMRNERCDTGMCVVKLRARGTSLGVVSRALSAAAAAAAGGYSLYSSPPHTSATQSNTQMNATPPLAGNSITTVIGSPLWSQQRQSHNNPMHPPPHPLSTSPTLFSVPRRVMPGVTSNLLQQQSPSSSMAQQTNPTGYPVTRSTPEGDGGPPARATVQATSSAATQMSLPHEGGSSTSFLLNGPQELHASYPLFGSPLEQEVEGSTFPQTGVPPSAPTLLLQFMEPNTGDITASSSSATFISAGGESEDDTLVLGPPTSEEELTVDRSEVNTGDMHGSDSETDWTAPYT